MFCKIFNLFYNFIYLLNLIFISVLQTTQRKSRGIVGKIRKSVERLGSGQKENEKRNEKDDDRYDDSIDREGGVEDGFSQKGKGEDGFSQKGKGEDGFSQKGKGEDGAEEGEMLMVMIEGIRELAKR